MNLLRFAVAGSVSPRTLSVLLDKLNDEEKLANLSTSNLCSVIISVMDGAKAIGSRAETEKFVRVLTAVLLRKDFGETRTFPLLKMAEKIAKSKETLSIGYSPKLFDRLCEYAVTQKLDLDKIGWLSSSLRNAVSSAKKLSS